MNKKVCLCARVSTDQQATGLESQVRALNDYCDELECVVVYSFSRFARSTTHMLAGIEEMKKHNTIFVSLTEKEKQEAEKTAKESTRNIFPEAA